MGLYRVQGQHVLEEGKHKLETRPVRAGCGPAAHNSPFTRRGMHQRAMNRRHSLAGVLGNEPNCRPIHLTMAADEPGEASHAQQWRPEPCHYIHGAVRTWGGYALVVLKATTPRHTCPQRRHGPCC